MARARKAQRCTFALIRLTVLTLRYGRVLCTIKYFAKQSRQTANPLRSAVPRVLVTRGASLLRDLVVVAATTLAREIGGTGVVIERLNHLVDSVPSQAPPSLHHHDTTSDTIATANARSLASGSRTRGQPDSQNGPDPLGRLAKQAILGLGRVI